MSLYSNDNIVFLEYNQIELRKNLVCIRVYSEDCWRLFLKTLNSIPFLLCLNSIFCSVFLNSSFWSCVTTYLKSNNLILCFSSRVLEEFYQLKTDLLKCNNIEQAFILTKELSTGAKGSIHLKNLFWQVSDCFLFSSEFYHIIRLYSQPTLCLSLPLLYCPCLELFLCYPMVCSLSLEVGFQIVLRSFLSMNIDKSRLERVKLKFVSPYALRATNSLEIFKYRLKTHLFQEYFD